VDEELVGKIGEVVTRIEGGDEPGEVSLLVYGMRERYFALGREEIPVGSKVLVIHDRGNRTVDVEPWSGL
jgi:membrane protein implicated in regulation of membrane protease activity